MTKAFWENMDQLRLVHPLMNTVTKDNVALTGVQLHPGAERFWREIGVLE
jgi:hypothetical protein